MIQVVGPVRTGAASPRPISVVASLPALTRTLKVYAALFQALPANTGNIYVGLSTLNRSTLADVAAILAIPTVNLLPSFGISLTLSPAGVDLSSLYLDSDVLGDGALVTLLVM
jgi:hypothetical protein